MFEFDDAYCNHRMTGLRLGIHLYRLFERVAPAIFQSSRSVKAQFIVAKRTWTVPNKRNILVLWQPIKVFVSVSWFVQKFANMQMNLFFLTEDLVPKISHWTLMEKEIVQVIGNLKWNYDVFKISIAISGISVWKITEKMPDFSVVPKG